MDEVRPAPTGSPGLRPDYPLRTARLRLRPFRPDDLDDLTAIQSRPEVARFLYWDARDPDQVREALAQKTGQAWLDREGDRLSLAVVLPPSGTVIGEVSLTWLSRHHRQGEIGFVFHPGHQGRGYAGEAAEVILRLGFAGLGLHRIIGRCDPRNLPSARLLARLGMRCEAHFVHNELFKGEWGDELVYAILEHEWTASRHPAGPA
jgi:RimJ/RimL family protein N-acetyltransferase